MPAARRTFAAHSHFLAWQLIYVRMPQRKCWQKDTLVEGGGGRSREQGEGSKGQGVSRQRKQSESTRHFHSENYAKSVWQGKRNALVRRHRANVSVYKNSHFNICQLAAQRWQLICQRAATTLYYTRLEPEVFWVVSYILVPRLFACHFICGQQLAFVCGADDDDIAC